MTSGHDSSAEPSRGAPASRLDSLAGVFHPHAIGVQEFTHYARVIDVRPKSAFEEDHIPGAKRIEPMGSTHGLPNLDTEPGHGASVASDGPYSRALPQALGVLMTGCLADAAVLVYCGRGGLDSLPVARALCQHGWRVDVLPGGWINYRRWVQAGLELLPRLIMFRVAAASSTSEARQVLSALAGQGHQTLDVADLVAGRQGWSQRGAPAPSQAWFDSLLLRALRGIDPARPLWVAGSDADLGHVRLPGAMVDALRAAR